MSVPQALVGGRYRLIEVIAHGGMGVVWRGRDERLDRPVAVKQLRTHPGITDREAEIAKNRAIREAHITAQLEHPHAVPVLDAVEHEGQPCLVMPYLLATPLSAVLRKRKTLPLHDVIRIGAQTASALAAAHRLRIVHRDVKPGNVLITDDGTAHLSDFGISHAMGDATLTDTGFLHGTPAYLSPEVARGGSAIFASDVFSLGSTLYAALEGAPPFGSDPNPIALLHKVAAARVEPPGQAGALTPLLLQMLSEQGADRPTMDEVATSLAHLRAHPAPPEQPQPEAGSRATSSQPPSAALSSWFPPTEGASTAPVARAAATAASSQAAAESPSAGATHVDQGPPRRPVLVALLSIAALAVAVFVFTTLTGQSEPPETAGDRVALPTSSEAASDDTAASTPAELSSPTGDATSPPATSDAVAAP
ncbi:MAG: serine/threonine-protein kinase, partial [Ornithinimicrobium sp.]|uniref:serine/threonine-protein kinase n=1 Tax=Ornithinimicrobium sp. TaxID=1977084 RepID=UPI003D9AE760